MKIRRLAKTTASVLLATLVIFFVVEGLASTIVVGRVVADGMQALGERSHSQYDAELGWVNIPRASVPDMYGPGLSLVTNAQGFRDEHDTDPRVPPGRTRVLCSGDSFTLGVGVSTRDAWCNALERIDPRIDAVNMGQGGYGVDQSYLWYRRDAAPLEYHVQVFAVIAADFERMRSDTFLGYGKPTLAVEDGGLVVGNTPVPYRSAAAVKRQAILRTVSGFRVVQLLHSFGGAPKPELTPAGNAGDPLRPVVDAVITSLARENARRESRLLLAFLPTREDYDRSIADGWRHFVRGVAAREGVAFVDFVERLRELPVGQIDTLFIKPGDVPYGHAEGHYTVRGNEFVARALYEYLGPLTPAGAAK
jgi:hypothetical protein